MEKYAGIKEIPVVLIGKQACDKGKLEQAGKEKECIGYSRMSQQEKIQLIGKSFFVISKCFNAIRSDNVCKLIKLPGRPPEDFPEGCREKDI